MGERKTSCVKLQSHQRCGRIGEGVFKRSLVGRSQVWLLKNRYLKGDSHKCFFFLKNTKTLEQMKE